MIYQLKNYVEIATILKNKEMPVDEFILQFDLSQYEYKNDLLTIQEMQTSYGVSFQCEEGRNILSYRITDENIFSIVYPIFNELYFRYLNNKIHSKKFIISCIVSWTLLSKKVPMLTTDIAEQLGYTRSGLREPLKWTSNFLKDYHLQYTNVPHYGIQVNGNEFYKRLAIISLNNFIDPRIIIGLDQSLIFNHEDTNFMSRIHSAIEELNSFQGITISYINTKLLSYYLIIQHNRIRRNFYVTDSFPYEREISNTFEYFCAAHLLKRLYSDIVWPLPAEEVIYLSVFIITINEKEDYYHGGYTHLSDLFRQECEAITDSICTLLKNNYGLVIGDPVYAATLRKAVNRIVLKHHCFMASLQGFSLSGKSFAAAKKPLLLVMRNEILELLSNQYQIVSKRSNIIELIDVIQRFVQTQQVFFPKKHLCIMSHINVTDSLLLKETIGHLYPGLFYENIKIISDPQLIDICAKDTVYISNYLLHAKGKNVYILDDYHNDIKDLPSFLISNGHLSRAHIGKLDAYRLQPSFPEDQILLDLNIDAARYKAIARNSMLFLIDYHSTDIAELKLIEISKKIDFLNHKKIDKIIVLDCRLNNGNILLFDHILTLFVTDSSFFQSLFQKPDFSTLDAYLEKMKII